VVVGAGLLGLSAAAELCRRGREVVVLEQAAVGHSRSGSKGSSRIFRLGYDDPRYVKMAKAALPLWRDLEADTGADLLTTTGQVTFGPGIEVLAGALSQAGAAAEIVPAGEVERRFPAVAAPGPAVFEAHSGMLHAAECLAVMRRMVGESLYEGVEALRVTDGEHHGQVITRAGAIRASVVVCCAGPWTAPLLRAGGIRLPLSTTLEQVAYLPVASRESLPLPVIVDRTDPSLYGLPTPEALVFKVGRHHAGDLVEPDAADMSPDRFVDAHLSEAATRLLPGLDPRPVRSERCFYDNSPDHDFVVDRVGRIVMGAGTSGHGFKFGPLLGQVLADLASGAPAGVPIGWWRGARFG
jgi:sarcosine oxidase